MKIKTSELEGAALDWAVAKCEGWIKGDITHPKFCRLWRDQIRTPAASPSTDWVQGGPIIEREKIEITYWHQPNQWRASTNERIQYDERGEFIEGSDFQQFGHTPLIAAMRAFVASHLGDEVEIPEELL